MFEAVQFPSLGNIIVRLFRDDPQCVVDDASPLLQPWCSGLGPGNRPRNNGRRLQSGPKSLFSWLAGSKDTADNAGAGGPSAVADASSTDRSFLHSAGRKLLQAGSAIGPDAKMRTLTCGSEHLRLFGTTGYESKDYWCYIAKEALVVEPGRPAGVMRLGGWC